MNFNSIKTSFQNTIGKTRYWFKQNSPTLLIIGGVISSAAAVVLAVVETKKAEKYLPEAKERIQKLKAEMNDDNLVRNGEVSIPENKKELNKVYAQTGLKLAKTYAPSVILYIAAIACFIGSHKIMQGRVVALSSAYAALDTAYKAYRSRVAGKLGKEAEQDLYDGIVTEKQEIVDENGNKQVVKKKVKKYQSGSPYAVLWDASCYGWEPDGPRNKAWLEMLESGLNQQLAAKKYMFLYDVYKELGIPEGSLSDEQLQASHVVGWIYDPKNPNGDNYISIGLRDRHTGNYTQKAIDMMRGERNVWLDFNVDGDILTGDRGKRTFITSLRKREA